MDESLHLQLQKVSRNLIGLLRNSKVLCPTLEPSTYNSFCPIFFLYSCSLPLFLVCLLFPPLTYCFTLSCQKSCLSANLEFDCPAYFISTFAFVTIHFSPIKTQFFFLNLQTCSICPSFPLSCLYRIWCLCGQSYFCLSLCLSSTNLALPLPSCRIQSLLALVFPFSEVVLFQVCFQIGSSPLLFLNLAGGTQSQHKKHDSLT